MIFRRKSKTTTNDRQIDWSIIRARIHQKKRLYFHFVAFICFSSYGHYQYRTPAMVPIFSHSVSHGFGRIALECFAITCFQVYVTKRFMNPVWEKQQVKTLVGLQEARIEKIKRKLDKEASLQADAEWHKEESQSKQRITILQLQHQITRLEKTTNSFGTSPKIYSI